jgi:predicted flap endonuclease-1-like 5' DNA nuclease
VQTNRHANAGDGMAYKIDEIEGIGPAYAEKLSAAGIASTDDLLARCGSAKGRDEIAEATGLSTKQLLKWANMADLMRISGVGEEYSELLEAAGVDTVKELKHRNAENLAEKMREVNDVKKLTRQVPAANQVAQWIEQAGALDPKISH